MATARRERVQVSGIPRPSSPTSPTTASTTIPRHRYRPQRAVRSGLRVEFRAMTDLIFLVQPSSVRLASVLDSGSAIKSETFP